jgi:hypothetical protein
MSIFMVVANSNKILLNMNTENIYLSNLLKEYAFVLC